MGPMSVNAFIRRLITPVDPIGTAEPARVAVIDVGSNTARLLVAEETTGGTGRRVGEAKANLGLGAEIVRRGAIGSAKLSETARETGRFATIARELGAEAID